MNDADGCAPTLSRLVAGLFAAIFAVALPMTLVAFAWGQILFSADQMTDIIAEELIESGALQELAIEVLIEQVPRGGDGAAAGLLDFLGRERLNEMLAALFPAEWAESQVRGNIGRLYAWIDSDLLLPQLGLDIRPIKDRLLAGGAEQLAETVVSSWPNCGPEQLQLLLTQGVPQGELPAFLCQPPEPLRAIVVGVASDLVQSQIRSLPDAVPLPVGAAGDATAEEIAEFKSGLRSLRSLSQAGWLLPLSMLGLIVAVTVRSWSALLRWWGGSLLAAGLITFVMIGVGESRVEQARDSRALADVIPGPFLLVVGNIANRLIETVSGELFFLGFVIAVIGLAMLLAGIYLGRRTATTSIPKSP